MLTVQFSFNLRYIVHIRANRHNNSVLNELRKLTDLPGLTGEIICVINILQNFTHFSSSWHEKVSKVLLRPQTPNGKAYSAPSYSLTLDLVKKLSQITFEKIIQTLWLLCSFSLYLNVLLDYLIIKLFNVWFLIFTFNKRRCWFFVS